MFHRFLSSMNERKFYKVSRLEIFNLLKSADVNKSKSVVIEHIIKKFYFEETVQIIKTIERQLSSKFLNRVAEKMKNYKRYLKSNDHFERSEKVWLDGDFEFVLTEEKIKECNKQGKYNLHKYLFTVA